MSPWHALAEMSSDATEAVVVAPFMKRPALEMVLKQIDPLASVVCVTRWTPLDIQFGSSDVACRSLVVDRGGSFQLHNRLHAKYFRFGDRILVGSANVTASGLGYASGGNIEVLCEPHRSFEWTDFESRVLLESREISDAEFDFWKDCPTTPWPKAPAGFEQPSTSLDGWKPQTRNPDYLWFSYVGQESRIATFDQRVLARVDSAALNIPPNLNRSEFETWIRACLRASPFVDTVKSLEGSEDAVIWSTIAEEWGTSMGLAARWASTAQYWIKQFDP